MFNWLKPKKSAPVLMHSIAMFGKLPGIADYTKVNTHLEHAIQVNASVERLVSSLHEQESDRVESLDIQCVFEQEGRWLVIQLLHSQDKSGRSYPFTAVGYIDHPLMKACLPAMPLVLEPFKAYMRTVQAHVTSKQALEQAIADAEQLRFSHSKATLLEDEIVLLRTMQQCDWIEHAYPSTSLQSIADGLLESGKKIQSVKQGERVYCAFPLDPSHQLISVTLWLQWIEGLLQPKRWTLQYVQVSTRHGAFLHVWLLPLGEKITALDMEAWVQAPNMAVPHGHASAGFIAVLSQTGLSICEALYRWQQEVQRATVVTE